jgi:lysozyme family protein
MAASNWPLAVARILQHEGGYVDDPDDPGGKTNLGITQATLSAYLRRPASKADVQALDVTTAKTIYKRQYWDTIKGDLLPAGIDYAVCDFCVHSGPDRAARDLQKVLKMPSPDGVIGEKTLAAIQSYELGVQALIRNYCARRKAYMKSLKGWTKYKNGWSRRVDEVQAAAARLASKGTQIAELPPVEVINPGANDKASPTDKKLSFSGRFWASMGAGGGTAVAVTDSAVGLLSPDKIQKVGDKAVVVADTLQPYSGLRIVGYVVAGLGAISAAIAIYMTLNSIWRGQD